MTDARDYSATLFLPQTDFPMRAGLPQKEPEILARWAKLGMYQRLREAARGRTADAAAIACGRSRPGARRQVKPGPARVRPETDRFS